MIDPDAIKVLNEAFNNKLCAEVEMRVQQWLEKAKGTDWTAKFLELSVQKSYLENLTASLKKECSHLHSRLAMLTDKESLHKFKYASILKERMREHFRIDCFTTEEAAKNNLEKWAVHFESTGIACVVHFHETE